MFVILADLVISFMAVMLTTTIMGVTYWFKGDDTFEKYWLDAMNFIPWGTVCAFAAFRIEGIL